MAWPNGPEETDVPVEKKELTAWTVSTYYKKSIERTLNYTLSVWKSSQLLCSSSWPLQQG